MGYWEVYRRFRGRGFYWQGIGGEGCIGGSFDGRIFHGGREFSMKGVPDFPGLFKDDQKLK